MCNACAVMCNYVLLFSISPAEFCLACDYAAQSRVWKIFVIPVLVQQNPSCVVVGVVVEVKQVKKQEGPLQWFHRDVYFSYACAQSWSSEAKAKAMVWGFA